MATSREHVTNLPRGFIVVRILQVLFTITIFSLSLLIYSQYRTFAPPAYTWPSLGVAVAASITLPVLAWIILSTYYFPRAYNYWALLPIEIFFTGVWVYGFLWASGSGYNPNDKECRSMWTDEVQTFTEYCPVITNEALWYAAGNARFPLMGFAGGLAILWLTSFIVVSVFIARHRKAGKHCRQEV